MRNTIGVVLAAGLGMRLRPSTEKCPKPLIPVGGIEPLFFALYKLSELGVKKVVVNAHYLSEKIHHAIVHWSQLLPDLDVRVVDEKPEILGTGGAIINIVRKNLDWFDVPGASLLLQNGDTLAQFELKDLLKNENENTLAVSFNEDHLKKYNPLWLDAQGFYSGIGKVPKDSTMKAAHFLGVHYLSPKSVKKIVKDPEFSISNIDLFNGIYKPLSLSGEKFKSIAFFKAVKKKILLGDEFWFDMTTQEFLLEAQRYVLDSLGHKKIWSDVLKKRFPQIAEYSPGVWVESQNIHEPHFKDNYLFKSPAVFVEVVAGSRRIPIQRLVVGPHASVIHETGSFHVTVPDKQDPIEVKNAVVFSDSVEKTDLVSEKICDRICVL